MKVISVNEKNLQIGFKGIVNSVDESLLPSEYCRRAENFAFEDGVLTGGIGIDRAQGYYPLPNTARHEYPAFGEQYGIVDVYVYRRRTDGVADDRLVVHLSNGYFWYTRIFADDEWHIVPGLLMQSDVCAVNYNDKGDDVLLLSSPNDYLYVLNGEIAQVCTSAPSFTSLCVHNERVFGSVNQLKNQVWFSDDFNPGSWTVGENGAGYIDFADECGDVIKIVPFLDYLYIFREHGIFRLTAYGDPNEFLVKKLFTNTGRIYKASICVCGDKIIFLADEGLFAFDGYASTRIAKELPPLENKHKACGAYLNDCYYLACCQGLTVEQYPVNDTVVKYDLKAKQMSVLAGYDIRALCAVKVHNASDVLCVFNDDNWNVLGMMSKSGKVLGSSTVKKYFSPCNIASTYYLKTVRELDVLTEYPLTVKVNIDGSESRFDLQGCERPQKIVVEKSGYRLGIALESSSPQAKIAPLNMRVNTHRQ